MSSYDSSNHVRQECVCGEGLDRIWRFLLFVIVKSLTYTSHPMTAVKTAEVVETHPRFVVLVSSIFTPRCHGLCTMRGNRNSSCTNWQKYLQSAGV